jgi:hypothetical protein
MDKVAARFVSLVFSSCFHGAVSLRGGVKKGNEARLLIAGRATVDCGTAIAPAPFRNAGELGVE